MIGRRSFIEHGSAAIICLISSQASAQSLKTRNLFVEISRFKIPKGTSNIQTSGWSSFGSGAGIYIADDLARQLVDSHPRFCARSANGIAFRLLPSGGAIWVEQGGANGDQFGNGANNDRAAFQSAVNYAAAIGIETIALAQQSYAIWHSTRTTSPATMASDGHGIVVYPRQKVRLVGTGATPARIQFRNDNGESLDGLEPYQNYQVINGEIWRGSGILVWTHRNGQDPARSSLALENVWLDGGYRRDTRYDSDASLAWDVHNKGIFVAPDGFGGSVTLANCRITGWRGESVYCSNDPNSNLTVRNVVVSDSNGQGLNPNGCGVDVENCQIANCLMGIEGWTGRAGGRIVKTVISDCFGRNGTGRAFCLQGGMYGRSNRSAYFAPTMVDPNIVPMGSLEITCKKSGPACVGWWLSGQLNMIETPLHLGEPMAFNEGTQSIALEVTLINQDLGMAYIFIAGGSGTAGDMLTNKCDLRVQIGDHADYSGPRRPPAMWYGSLGSEINATIGNAKSRPAPQQAGATPDFSPNFVYLQG